MSRENKGFNKLLQPSDELAAIVGSKSLSRPQLTRSIWQYIKKHKLQNPKDKREILCDEKMKAVIGSSKINMFKMTKKLAEHLS